MVRAHTSSSRTALLGRTRCQGSFGTRRRELQQFWHGLDVPVGIFRLGMAEVSAELDHLAIWVEPLAVPPYDRPNREGVPQIMDARPASMLAEALRLAQTEILADDREVVTRATVGRPLTAFDLEERSGRGAKQPRALGAVGAEPGDCARRQRYG